MLLLNQTRRLEELHREVRDPDPCVWEPACARLGREAAADRAAWAALSELLTASARELRLRGISALRTMAPLRPQEVGEFLTGCITDRQGGYDPLLFDALLSVYPCLPGDFGKQAVGELLKDSDEAVRSAAAAALRYWRDWPDGTLYRLANDPSLLVRAGLVTALPELADTQDKADAVEALSQAPDPQLVPLLEDLERPAAPSPRRTARPPQPLDEDQAAELLTRAGPSPLGAQRFEQLLHVEPEQTLLLLREGLEERGGGALLSLLAELCRDRSLGCLLRAWTCILNWQGQDPATMMLRALGILDGAPAGPLVAPFRELVKVCAGAVECHTCADVDTWARSFRLQQIVRVLWRPAGAPSDPIARSVEPQLEALVEVGEGLDSFDLLHLSGAASSLLGLAPNIEATCPRPERDLLLATVSVWLSLVERETRGLLCGGDLS